MKTGKHCGTRTLKIWFLNALPDELQLSVSAILFVQNKAIE